MESAYSDLVWGRPANPNVIGGISDLKNLTYNILYLLKEQILPENGYTSRSTETIVPQGITTDPDTGLIVTPYKTSYNDLVYYNPFPASPSLTGLITYPILSQSGNLAWIDYTNGYLYYSGIQTNSITTTYDYYSVLVQHGFPELGEEGTSLENLRVPLISIDFLERKDRHFQIGGHYIERREFVINVTAANDSQKEDLIDIIDNSLTYPYNDTIDYKYGFPVDFKGRPNSLFDRGPGSRWYKIQFLSQESKSEVIRDPRLPDKLRHQANFYTVIDITD